MAALRSWRLFWVLAASESVAICLGLPHADLRTVHGTESIVLWSVRCALPLFLLAFTASSLAILWPGRFTRWLLANRRYVGLAFAFAMTWHFAFVGYFFFEFGRRLNLTVTVLDLIGAAFLAALTLTSFRWSARRLGPTNWRRLHKTGVYVIWLLALYIYASGARYQRDPIHLGGTAIFVAAFLVRVAAGVSGWRRKLARQETTAARAGGRS